MSFLLKSRSKKTFVVPTADLCFLPAENFHCFDFSEQQHVAFQPSLARACLSGARADCQGYRGVSHTPSRRRSHSFPAPGATVSGGAGPRGGGCRSSTGGATRATRAIRATWAIRAIKAIKTTIRAIIRIQGSRGMGGEREAVEIPGRGEGGFSSLGNPGRSLPRRR